MPLQASLFLTSGLLCVLLAIGLLSSRAVAPLCARMLGANYLLWAWQNLLGAAVLSGFWPAAGLIRPMSAMAVGPLMVCFYLSVMAPQRLRPSVLLPHMAGLAPVPMAIFSGQWQWVDPLIIASFAVYPVGVTWMHWRAPAPPFPTRQAVAARLCLWILTAAMLVNLVIEIATVWEVGAGTPRQQSAVLAVSGGVFLLLHLAAMVTVLTRAPVLEWLYQLKNWPARREAPPASEQLALFKRWEILVRERELFRSEAGIDLSRGARLLGVPARQLSRAINDIYGASFTQYLNDQRVALAQKLLREQSQLAIAELYMEAGFATKSHFHREFNRVTGQSPGAYRKEAIGA